MPAKKTTKSKSRKAVKDLAPKKAASAKVKGGMKLPDILPKPIHPYQ